MKMSIPSLSLSVKAKLILLVLSALIGSAVLGITGTWAVGRVAGLVGDMYDKQLSTIVTVADANVRLVNYQNTLQGIAVEADAEARKKLLTQLDDNEKALLELIGKYKQTELTEKELGAIDEFEGTWFAYKATVKEVLDASASGERDAAIDVMGLVAKPTYDSAAENLARIVEINRAAAQESFAQSQQLAARIKVAQILMAGFVAITGLILGAIVARGIFGPLHIAANAMQRIGAGDLNGTITVESHDEIGAMMQSLIDMQTRLSETLRLIMRTATQVSEAANAMVMGTQSVAQSSQEQVQAAARTTTTVNDLVRSIEEAAQYSQHASARVSEAGERAEQGSSEVSSTASGVAAVSTRVSEASAQVHLLSSKADHISDVVAVIREVAEQTNLLALNAAIEAARAGEQGRGFAVVADEVRKLAERTTQSTGEIQQMANDIQQSVGEIVHYIDGSLNTVSDISSAAAKANQAMDQIRVATGTVLADVSHIANALDNQRSASQVVMSNITQLGTMSEENDNAVAQIFMTASALASIATELQQASTRFRIN